MSLLERERELAQLTGDIEEVQQGRGAVRVVEGAAGIGKTSLLAAAGRLARDADVRVLSARGGQLEAGFSFGVVRQLFEPLLFGAAPEERRAWLAGAARLAESMLDPLQAVDPTSLDDASYARLHGLFWLTANIARDRPLLLAVDDAHWADEPSLRYLHFLAARLEELPVLALVATRPGQETVSDLVPMLVADPAARPLRPAPLSGGAVVHWVRETLGPAVEDAFGQACHAATGGNPLLMAELIREVASERIAPVASEAPRVAALGPEGVARVVLLRLGRLPSGAPRIARAVAVLGHSANVPFAAELAGVDGDAAVAAVEALLNAEILSGDEPLSFVHPIVRAAVYDDIPGPERSALHARAAELLSRWSRPTEEVAAQLLSTDPGSTPWATGVLRDEAGRALALGDPDVAVRYLTRALAERTSDRAVLLAELGRAEARAGRADAVEHLEQAIALAADPADHARAALELAGLLKFAGDSRRAVEVLRAAAAALGDQDAELAERVQVELIGSAYISVSARRMLADRIVTLTDPGRPPETFLERFQLAAMCFDAFAAGRPADEVAELATRALAGGELPTDPVAGGHAFVSATIGLQFAERFEEADRLYTGALADARRRGSGVSFAAASSLRSLVNYRRGRLLEAEADARAALALAGDVHGSQGYLSAALGTLVYTSLDRGTVDAELEATADRFLVEQATDNLPYTHAIHGRACLLVARGELRRGLEEILAAGRRELEWGAVNPAITPWRSSAALVHAALGETERARALATEEVELARAFGAPRCLGVALRAAGLVDASVATLTEAVEVLEGSAARLELARALVDLGATTRAAGDPGAARAILSRGLELASACAATALADRARAELLASGARPRRTALAGVDALTPSERRVAEMAAGGMSNREIAQALFVTEKTVETHLGKVYAKLDVRSRRQLPVRLTAP